MSISAHDDATQICSECQKDLPLSAFPYTARGVLSKRCRACLTASLQRIRDEYREAEQARLTAAREAIPLAKRMRRTKPTRERVRRTKPARELVKVVRVKQQTPGKPCASCGRAREEAHFYGAFCPDCRKVRAEQRLQSERYKRAAYDRHLRRSYGITLAEYEAMHDRQKGLCAICGQPETQIAGRNGTTPLRLAVDHDHETGAVRALLCGSCNQGIGYFKHDIKRLMAAIEYLRQPHLL